MRRERYSGRFSRLKELVTFENWEQLRGLESKKSRWLWS